GTSSSSNVRNICPGGNCNNASYEAAYTVVVLEPTGCLSSPSNEIVVHYGTNGPPAPVGLPVVTPISASKASISWNDVAGETGYELWRFRHALGSYPGEPYAFVKSIPANTTSVI